MALSKVEKKRDIKENAIVDAAERIFAAVGFANAKMEDIAEEAGISKGTVYFYFDTKENLYLAIAYRGMQKLNDSIYDIVAEKKGEKAIESVTKITSTFMDFSENYFLYSEALLYYMSINRSSNEGKNKAKLTVAIDDSIYWRKLQDMHNIPINLVTQEIERGKIDKSITSKESPVLLYLYAWANVIGFMKLNVAAGRNHATLHGLDIQTWKDFHLKIGRQILAGSNDSN